MTGAAADVAPGPGRRVFYGWFIVAAASLIIFSTGPGQSYVFAVFIDPMIDETGLSRTGISMLYLASTLLSAVLVTIVSRLADLYGPRIMLMIAGLGLGAACFGMATATHILLFFVAFAALRALGQGSLHINCVLLVNQWFVSRRGRAIGLMTIGSMLSVALYPSFARFLIDSIGWRESYGLLGVVAIGVIVPVAFLVVRNRPEDLGLYPDGSTRPPLSESRQAAAGPRRAVGVYTSPAFWLLAISLSSPSLITTALMFHQASIFEENGLSATLAAAAFAIFSVSSGTSSLVGGFLSDRVGPKVILVLSMSILLVTLALGVLTNSLFMAVLYVVMMGTSSGFYVIVLGTIWAHYYGRQGLGRIQGPAMTVSVCASAIGPLPLAMFQEWTGTYTVGMLAMMALPILSFPVVIFARPGRTEETH